MKNIKNAILVLAGSLLSMQQAFAGVFEPPNGDGGGNGGGYVIPEIDGAGAIIAIGLVAGLVALFREKFFRK